MPNKILDVHYEKLVTEPKAIINTMLDCIGLDWNDNCLAFHTQQRAVQTASNWQVRQPLYHSSINRWKDYRDQLAPLINRLQPLPQAN